MLVKTSSSAMTTIATSLKKTRHSLAVKSPRSLRRKTKADAARPTNNTAASASDCKSLEVITCNANVVTLTVCFTYRLKIVPAGRTKKTQPSDTKQNVSAVDAARPSGSAYGKRGFPLLFSRRFVAPCR